MPTGIRASISAFSICGACDLNIFNIDAYTILRAPTYKLRAKARCQEILATIRLHECCASSWHIAHLHQHLQHNPETPVTLSSGNGRHQRHVDAILSHRQRLRNAASDTTEDSSYIRMGIYKRQYH
jgi:hypothetical protein